MALEDADIEEMMEPDRSGDVDLATITSGFARTFEGVDLVWEHRIAFTDLEAGGEPQLVRRVAENDPGFEDRWRSHMLDKVEVARKILEEGHGSPVVARPEFKAVGGYLCCECYYHPDYVIFREGYDPGRPSR